MAIITTELPVSSPSGDIHDLNAKGFNATFYMYLYISLVLLVMLVGLKGCLVYTAKKKQRRNSG